MTILLEEEEGLTTERSRERGEHVACHALALALVMIDETCREAEM